MDNSKYLIQETVSIKKALEKLNMLPNSFTLFTINEKGQLTGSLTDGDIRRGIIKGVDLNEPVSEITNKAFSFLNTKKWTNDNYQAIKVKGIKLIPFLDEEGKLERFITADELRCILPVHAVIMAGGKGSRLLPLTESVPKSLLKVGQKPILEINIDRLIKYGLPKISISINHLGEQIEQYFQDKHNTLEFVMEEKPLGTLGAVSQIDKFESNTIMVVNADLLTNIDFEDFYRTFVQGDFDLVVATVPYKVKVPYAVFKTSGDLINEIDEKPEYTYYSNAGMYLFKRDLLSLVPKNEFYNATDLLEQLIKNNKKVGYFPINGYWLDIGKHEDYKKAQEDIKHIDLGL